MHTNPVGVLRGVLSTAFNQAVYDGLILAEPCARVKKAAARGETPVCALSEQEASGLVRAAGGPRDEALIVLALRTGMR